MYKHNENTIDPRDTNLITYVPKTKRFICEASMLKANGIEPVSHHFTIGGSKFVIHLWSEKFQTYICYRFKEQKWFRGELIADIFTPYFGIISTDKELKAHDASIGTELHILND